jgi:hypothetical protein
LAIPDYFTVANALAGGGPEPMAATVSFTVAWGGELSRLSARSEDVGFAGEFVVNTAILSWTAENADGFSFQAAPFDDGFAMVGSMRNGSFFS